mmetsp:Transcript_88352/g.176680  ORF Transcript_88352/g.176680 Transcript_88352/m.176680 type:complete len:181 (+) Transcript_88352:40-582(+)
MQAESKRMALLRKVMRKALDTTSETMKAPEAQHLFQSLTKERPQLRSSIADYHPQILQQIADGAKDDFENLCSEYRIMEKLRSLEELLESIPDSVAESSTAERIAEQPEESMREQDYCMKHAEYNVVFTQLNEIEQHNKAILQEIRLEERKCKASLAMVGKVESEAARAVQMMASTGTIN